MHGKTLWEASRTPSHVEVSELELRTGASWENDVEFGLWSPLAHIPRQKFQETARRRAVVLDPSLDGEGMGIICGTAIFLFSDLFIFNRMMVALQYWVGFYRASAWIRHRLALFRPDLDITAPSLPLRPPRLFLSLGGVFQVTQEIPVGCLVYIR